MRPIGTAAELERRRHLAVARLRDGHSADEVADFLGVHVRTVYRWRRAAGTPTGLAAKPPPGRPRKLTPAQERRVIGWVRKSPRAFGFPTDLWTAARVAAVIARTWAVEFNTRYLSAWLRARGVTPQKPQRVPREADPSAIHAWRTAYWPRLQNGRVAGGPPSASSTSAG